MGELTDFATRGREMSCAFCGQNKKTQGTEFVDMYCIECHRANIKASQEAIRIIKGKAKARNAFDEEAFQEAFGDLEEISVIKPKEA